MQEEPFEVAIAGGGPVGLCAALLLGRLGLRTLLLEKNRSTSQHPRGHVISARSLEILRTLGLADEVAAAALPLERHQGVAFVTRLAGHEIGTLRYRGDPRSDAFERAISTDVKRSCPQDLFEPILRRHAEALPGVRLAFDSEVTGLRQDADMVELSLAGPGRPAERVRARYVIAADGSRSTLRRLLGVAMGGLGRMGHQIGVCFEADLWPWIAERPWLLWWIYNPDCSGLFIALDGRHRWTFNFAYDPAEAGIGDFSEARCRAMITAAIGAGEIPIAIRSIQPWRMQARLAERFRVGRVFLAGDAAHPLPPTGGQGMNTGIADVHNLAWKLALSLRCRAGEGLLDSYDEERRPAAAANVEQSVRNATAMARSGLGGMLANDAALLARIDGPDGAEARQRLAAAIPEQRQHFDYHGQTFGFCYTSRGIVDDGTPVPPFSIETFAPDARPGLRAPHLWLQRAGQRLSSVELASGTRFQLLAAGEGAAWCAAARRAAASFGIELVAETVGPGGDLGELEGSFADLYRLGPGGAVLIRPDGHVGWRSAEAAADPQAVLMAALRQLLYIESAENRAPAAAGSPSQEA